MITSELIIAKILDTARKMDVSALNEQYWIRDFNYADNDNPFQYEHLTYEQMIATVENLKSDFIRVGIADGFILYDYYSYMDEIAEQIADSKISAMIESSNREVRE